MPASVHSLKPPVEDEFITVREFARRVHRNHRTVYKWIRLGKMPPGTVFKVGPEGAAHYEVNWTRYRESRQPVN